MIYKKVECLSNLNDLLIIKKAVGIVLILSSFFFAIYYLPGYIFIGFLQTLLGLTLYDERNFILAVTEQRN